MRTHDRTTPSAENLEPWPVNDTGKLMFIPCDNCGSASIVILDTPKGCVAFPGKPRLHVCPQHLNNWGFLDEDVEIRLISELEPGIARWAGW